MHRLLSEETTAACERDQIKPSLRHTVKCERQSRVESLHLFLGKARGSVHRTLMCMYLHTCMQSYAVLCCHLKTHRKLGPAAAFEGGWETKEGTETDIFQCIHLFNNDLASSYNVPDTGKKAE